MSNKKVIECRISGENTFESKEEGKMNRLLASRIRYAGFGFSIFRLEIPPLRDVANAASCSKPQIVEGEFFAVKEARGHEESPAQLRGRVGNMVWAFKSNC